LSRAVGLSYKRTQRTVTSQNPSTPMRIMMKMGRAPQMKNLTTQVAVMAPMMTVMRRAPKSKLIARTQRAWTGMRWSGRLCRRKRNNWLQI